MEHTKVSPLLAIEKLAFDVWPIRTLFMQGISKKGARLRTTFSLALGAAFTFVAPAALAAPTITGVSVKGTVTSFVWSTGPTAAQDTLFVAPGSGAGVASVVNPSNNFASTGLGTADAFGDYNFTLYGDGVGAVVKNARGKIVSAPNSDASYMITVSVKDGSKSGTLTGTWAGGVFVNTSSSFTGSTGIYQIDSFDWGRQLNNYVGKRSTSTVGDANATLADYRGDLSLTASPVPEPATWALLILGFGGIGGALRTRRSRKPTAAIA